MEIFSEDTFRSPQEHSFISFGNPEAARKCLGPYYSLKNATGSFEKDFSLLFLFFIFHATVFTSAAPRPVTSPAQEKKKKNMQHRSRTYDTIIYKLLSSETTDTHYTSTV